MSGQLDNILARSRAPGRFVERRRFTLSRDKAVEKLREFSLRRPEQYILELVQAAVFAGARWIAIDVSPERLFFAWVGGRHLTRDQLSGVFDYLFADRAAAETRHVVQLAVALNALLQRQPSVLRIESGDGSPQGTVRMDLDKQGKGHLGQPEDAFQGSYLVAEFETSWLSRFQGDQFTPEQGLVEQRCQYTPVPILLNYRAPFGYRSHRAIKLFGGVPQLPFDEDGRRGVFGLSDEAGNVSGVRIVVGGVWVTTLEIPELGTLHRGLDEISIAGVICDDRLRKTADQSDIVEDARWVEMLHALQPHASALLRRRRPDHQPPPLPRRLAEAPLSSPGSGPVPHRGPEPEPLPDTLEQVAPRPVLSVEDLAGLAADSPVFWCPPESAERMGLSGDPDRFPFRLLVLTPGQAVTLGEAAPHLSLGPIASAADAEFVTRVMARQAETREVELRVGPDRGVGADGTAGGGLGAVTGRLRLRLHLHGPAPAWGADDVEDVPVVVRERRQVRWCGGLHLGLPHVSAVLELEDGSFDPLEGSVALARLIRHHADRLLQPRLGEDAALTTPERALAIALLAMGAVPHLHSPVHAPDDVRLAVSLPREWERADALRTLPLAALRDGGWLTLDRFIALLGHTGTQGTAVLADAADLDRLEPLASRLGPGHLLGPVPDHAAALMVARVGDGDGARWVPWTGLPTPRVQALLWVGTDLAPRFAQAGWRTLPPPCPAVGLAVRAEEPGSPGAGVDSVQLTAGLSLLHDQLATPVREDTLERPGGESIRAMGRLALIALAATTGQRFSRVAARSDGAGWAPLDDLAAGRVRAAARHGVRVAEAGTVLLSWDEVAALRRAGHAVPLRFDDAPEVLHTLSTPERLAEEDDGPSASGWILRQQLQVPGLSGWLGLRAPYDPTSVVLLQQSGELIALTHVDRHVPCHGLAWTLGAAEGISRVQRDLLELARLRLYQTLAARLEAPGVDPSWRAVAEPYATDLAVHAWREAGGESPGGTAGQLLELIRLLDAEDRPLGSLGQWLSQPAGSRPVPVGHAARYQALAPRSSDAGQRRSGDTAATLGLLERRLGRVLALASQVPDLRVFIQEWEGAPDGDALRLRDEGSSFGVTNLELNVHHPLGYAGLAEAGDAREVLLLEAARVAIGALRETGERVDLLEVHQLLAAQRI